MKPIIFARVADMKYYRGITDLDTPVNGGAYVKETNMAHECFNFDPVEMEEGNIRCLGFAQLMGNAKNVNPQLHIERIVGCKAYRKEEQVDDVTVVFCAKARNSSSMRVVGFYKHATVYRHYQEAAFDTGYVQSYSFIAAKDDCVLIPYRNRYRDSRWVVPVSGVGSKKFGFGRANIWYAGSDTDDKDEIQYVERILTYIENYNEENAMEEEV